MIEINLDNFRPNSWRFSCLAGCAWLGSIIYIRNIEEHTNEDTKPKARSAASAGWAFIAIFVLYILFQYQDAMEYPEEIELMYDPGDPYSFPTFFAALFFEYNK